MNWKCKHTWPKAMKNTAWCLMGCSIGDFGTILYFQINNVDFPILETIVLTKELGVKRAFNTAIGMSLISMISMEASMNFVDYIATGGALLNFWVVPIMLLFGFITPLPYNYWRLKKHGISCH